jgi:hypothetical protein
MAFQQELELLLKQASPSLMRLNCKYSENIVREYSTIKPKGSSIKKYQIYAHFFNLPQYLVFTVVIITQAANAAEYRYPKLLSLI